MSISAKVKLRSSLARSSPEEYLTATEDPTTVPRIISYPFFACFCAYVRAQKYILSGEYDLIRVFVTPLALESRGRSRIVIRDNE
jgi:hypothetical protein